jgi:hypothetical protein
MDSVNLRTTGDENDETYTNLLANGNGQAVFIDLKGAMGALRAKKDLLYWSL